MASEWKRVPLGSFVSLQRGHDLTAEDRRPGQVPVMGSAGCSGYHDTARAPGPGVVIGRSGVGSMGAVHYCAVPFWPHNTTLYVTDFLGNDPLFVYYALKNINFRSYDSGSAQASLNRNYLANVPIWQPPIREQRAIAQVLSALDDKIELNRKMNETLEATARALFKSWFVDFDPVRAKSEGRTPSLMDAETSMAFPNEYVESDLGPIPKGWSVRCIGDLATIVGGSTPSTKEPTFWDNGTHFWATPKDLSQLETPAIRATERRITDSGLFQIGSGLLPPGTVLLSSRAPIGYLGVAEVPLAINQGFIAMKPNAGIPSLFLLRWAEAAHDEIVSRANGSTFLEISKSNFRPIQLVTATAPVFRAFEAATSPLYRRVVLNENETTILSGLRDGLLPRLLSGEVNVSGAGEVAKEQT